MATFNGEKYITEQFKSILSQTCAPCEVIISDDGSTDRTLEIVGELSKSAGFSVAIHQNHQRLGYSDNFLSATKRATGDYIAFCDQDDVWHKDKLKICVAAIEKSDCVLCTHSVVLVNKDLSPRGKHRNGGHNRGLYQPLTLMPWMTFAGFTMVFKAELLSYIPYEKRGVDYFLANRPLSHDSWVYFLASCFGKVVILNEPLALYRQHGENTIGSSQLGILSRISYLTGTSASPRLMRSNIAANWAWLLDQASLNLRDSTKAKLAFDASIYWKNVSKFETERVEMYATESLSRRGLALLYLAFSGCYRAPKHGGLGFGLVFKDLIVGLLRLRPLKV
jgi:glycosyltransferase involved in cell wall biosynthesis